MSYYDLTGNLRVIRKTTPCTCETCRKEAEEKEKMIPQNSFGCSTLFWAAVISFTLLSLVGKFM